MFLWAKYGTQTDIRFPMVKRGVVDLAATADWTPATGDTKISKDGGNYANTTNNPAAVGGTGSIGWKLTVTSTELQAAEVNIQIVDSATKAVEDQFLTIYTYGHASAKIQADLSDVVRLGLTALPNAAAEAAGGLFTRGTGAGQINQEANGYISVNLKAILGTALTETAGQIAAAFKKVFDVASPVFTATSVNQTGDSFARLGAPAGASVSADIAAAKSDTAAIKAKTDSLTFTTANKVDSTIQAAGDFAQGAADKVWSTATRALTDKVGFALSSAGVQAIWDALTSALSAVGSIGKLLVDNINATISSRLASASYTAPDNATISTINTKIGTPAASVSADIAGVQADTDNIKTRLPAALVGGRMASNAEVVGDKTGYSITSNIKTNQALANFEFMMTDSTTHAPATGKTVTVTRSIDGGAFAAGTLANIAEVSNGIYKVDFGAGDLNGKVITIRATAAGCDDTFATLVTTP